MPPRRVLAAPTAAPAASLVPASTGPIDLTAGSGVATGSGDRFVGLSGGTVYYLAACQAALELPAEFVVRYDSETAAQRDRRVRSKVPGC